MAERPLKMDPRNVARRQAYAYARSLGLPREMARMVRSRHNLFRQVLQEQHGDIGVNFKKVGPIPPAGMVTEDGHWTGQNTYFNIVVTRPDGSLGFVTVVGSGEMTDAQIRARVIGYLRANAAKYDTSIEDIDAYIESSFSIDLESITIYE